MFQTGDSPVGNFTLSEKWRGVGAEGGEGVGTGMDMGNEKQPLKKQIRKYVLCAQTRNFDIAKISMSISCGDPHL